MKGRREVFGQGNAGRLAKRSLAALPKLDEKYVRRTEPVIDEQLQKWHSALAEILNRALR